MLDLVKRGEASAFNFFDRRYNGIQEITLEHRYSVRLEAYNFGLAVFVVSDAHNKLFKTAEGFGIVLLKDKFDQAQFSEVDVFLHGVLNNGKGSEILERHPSDRIDTVVISCTRNEADTFGWEPVVPIHPSIPKKRRWVVHKKEDATRKPGWRIWRRIEGQKGRVY